MTYWSYFFPLVIAVLISDCIYFIENSQLYPQLVPTDAASVTLICKAVDLAHILCGPIPDTHEGWNLTQQVSRMATVLIVGITCVGTLH